MSGPCYPWAALACRLSERYPPPASPTLLPVGDGAGGAAAAVWHTRVVERVVSRLLCVAVADPSERVRKEVLRALAATAALDDYLAQVGGGGGTVAVCEVAGRGGGRRAMCG